MRYWAPYVPVAKRRAQAAKQLQKAKAKGKALNPVVIAGRQIANTFWGKAWCDNLENYSDYANRLPRGRTYVRSGFVLDLQISKGAILAQVMGSYLYEVAIEIKAMPASKWTSLVKRCSGKIESLIELLQGKFSDAVMSMIIDKESGLFPRPNEIEMSCSCPDGVGMCKHTAAVLYGIGASLDQQPEKLFTLRHVDHLELIARASTEGIIAASQPSADTLEDRDLSDVFGIVMAPAGEETKASTATQKKAPSQKSKKKTIFHSDERVELSVPQAAVLLKLSEESLIRLLNDKMIPFRREGKQRLISFEEIIKYRKNQG
ncbi:MAG TPA: helix-turn-helix domain-containing protein [Rhabdochlamydiaceae bacterium]|nr:helix-turn-helix domain-containing protein [Rhabdochlamydiaceae bacterium]HSX38870.1 helix-turn-helix domain-containing protein [Chlamydiales bacterium]